MTESLLIAIIGLAGAILAGLVGAFGAIAAVEIKGKEGNAVTGGCGIIGLAASAMAAVGLVVALLFAASIVRTLGLTTPSPTAIVQAQPSQVVIVVTATPPAIRPTAVVQSTEPLAIATTAPPSSNVSSCIATPHTGLAQGNYTFAGVAHVAELWRADRQSPWGDKLVTAFVLGNLNIVNAGGSVWTYPAGCEDAAKRDASDSVKRTGAQLVTESELRAAGMIK